MVRKRRTRADEPFLVVRSLASDFHAGGSTGRHAHDWHQLIHASAGVMTVWTERGSWVTPPRGALWVPAGIAHDIRFASDGRLRTLYLRPDWRADLPDQCTIVTVSLLLGALIMRAVQDMMLDRRDPVEAALATLIVEELRQSGVPPFELPEPASPPARHAAALIATGAPGGTAALAQAAGLGKRALERRFLAETGMSPGRWRRQRAFLIAVEQMAGGASVKTVAAGAGYADPSAFVVAFRRQFGVTPGRYFSRS